MKKFYAILLLAMFASISLTSCVSFSNGRSYTHPLVRFDKEDFEISDQVSATASVSRVIGIDWGHLFQSTSGSVGSTPVLGGIMSSKAERIAVYRLLKENPGYDVVMYPQFESWTRRPVLGIPLVVEVTKCTVTARLGKLKK